MVEIMVTHIEKGQGIWELIGTKISIKIKQYFTFKALANKNWGWSSHDSPLIIMSNEYPQKHGNQ